MKKFLGAVLIFLGAVCGGALAQSLGGGAITDLAASTLVNNIIISGSKVYSDVSSAANSFLWGGSLTLSGTAVSGNLDANTAPFNTFISADTVDTTTSGYGYLTGFNFEHQVSTGHTGGRSAGQFYLRVFGTPTVNPDSFAGYVAGVLLTNCNANLTGITGAYGNYHGACFGGNSNVFTTASATFLKTINGHEFDVTLASGASAADKFGISIVKGASDAVRGTYDDSAISMADQNGSSVGWLYGLSFGSYAHQWPFASDSTLIVAQTRQTGGVSPPIAKYGVDFSGVTFTTSGAPIRMPLLTPATSGESCSIGSMKWDASFIYVCTGSNTWKRATLSAF